VPFATLYFKNLHKNHAQSLTSATKQITYFATENQFLLSALESKLRVLKIGYEKSFT